MRLIDADALIENWQEDAEHMETEIFKLATYAAINDVKHAPTVAPERKEGKWIPVDSFSAFGGDESMWMAHGNPIAFYYCSNCKEQAYAGEDGQSLITDFCPNCGADMRTKETDYERAVEQLEHDMLYEPTFNQDDGSM